jgi:hypothetical protein
MRNTSNGCRRKNNNYSFKAVDASIRKLSGVIQQQATAISDTQDARLLRLLTIYAGLKPLLVLLSTLPIVPNTWRAALALFNSTLQALAEGTVAEPDFKAGKDL